MDGDILHADLDAFYASVEQLLRPELRGRPVLVGGGVVLAASYEARAFGISAPMGVRQALARCPHAVVVSGSFDRYLSLSRQVIDVLRRYTPRVEPVSIDEAFLDVSGAHRWFGSSVDIARSLRAEVRRETGLPISVGVARTKFLAKVASAAAKPDGLLAVDPDREIEFLHALPVRAMWGVGPATAQKLAGRGVVTVGDLAHTPEEALASWLGPGAGRHLHHLAWNRDPRRVVTGGRAGSVGSQSALGRGTADPDALRTVLLGLADRVGGRLRAKERVGRTVTVRVRYPDLARASRAVTLDRPISATEALFRAGAPLLDAARRDPSEPLTLVGISVSHLSPARPEQLALPFDRVDALSGSLDHQVDLVRARFGKGAVGRASVILGRRSVPDGFRELAERD